MREHGSWRPGILSHRIEVRKSTSGAAACSFTERWRCGRLSRRASMMPILSRWGSADIRHNIAQLRQGKTCEMAALPARKIILSYRHRGRARVHAVHSIGTTTSTKSVAPNPRSSSRCPAGPAPPAVTALSPVKFSYPRVGCAKLGLHNGTVRPRPPLAGTSARVRLASMGLYHANEDKSQDR